MATETVKITRKCAGCGQPMHLWQDNTGSGWTHDRLVDEVNCWRENRDQYEDGTL